MGEIVVSNNNSKRLTKHFITLHLNIGAAVLFSLKIASLKFPFAKITPSSSQIQQRSRCTELILDKAESKY